MDGILVLANVLIAMGKQIATEMKRKAAKSGTFMIYILLFFLSFSCQCWGGPRGGYFF